MCNVRRSARGFCAVTMFAVGAVLGPGAGHASSVTGEFSGTLGGDDVAGFSGEWMGVPASAFHTGDAVSGTFTYDPAAFTGQAIGATTNFTGGGVHFEWRIGSHHFSFDGPMSTISLGDANAPLEDYGIQSLDYVGDVNTTFYDYGVGLGVGGASLFSDRNDLASANFVGEVASFEFAVSFINSQTSEIDTLGDFNINLLSEHTNLVSALPVTPAATPIPATLPLFAAALGGLGFAGWRKRA